MDYAPREMAVRKLGYTPFGGFFGAIKVGGYKVAADFYRLRMTRL